MSATKKLAEKFLALFLAFSLLSPTLVQAAGTSEGGAELSGRSEGESLNLGASAAEQGLDLSGPEAAGARIDETVAPIGANLSGLEFPLPSVEASDGADSNGEKRDDIKPQAAQGGGSDAADSGSAADAREGLKASAAGNGAASPKDSALGELEAQASAIEEIAARQSVIDAVKPKGSAASGAFKAQRFVLANALQKQRAKAKASGASDDSSGLTPYITTSWLAKEDKKPVPPKTLRLQEKAQKVGVQEASLKTEVIRHFDYTYNRKLTEGPNYDQHQSGSCWQFAQYAMFRLKEKLSTAYQYSMSVLEKANTTVQSAIDSIFAAIKRSRKTGNKKALSKALDTVKGGGLTIEDGGEFPWDQAMDEKYGFVPYDVMPDTPGSKNTDQLLTDVNNHLGVAFGALVSLAQAGKLTPKVAAIIRLAAKQGVKTIIDSSLGKPRLDEKDGRFEYKGARYSPKEFMAKEINYDPRDFVVATDYPGTKNGLYQVKGSAIQVPAPGENPYPIQYLNLGPARILQLLVASILIGQVPWVGLDVVHNTHTPTGIMSNDIYGNKAALFNLPEDQLEPSRDEAFAQGLRGPDHAMAPTALRAKDVNRLIELLFEKSPDGKLGTTRILTEAENKEFLSLVEQIRIENSWGKDGVGKGNSGDFHATIAWLNGADGKGGNLYELAIRKSLLAPSEQKVLAGPAKILDQDGN